MEESRHEARHQAAVSDAVRQYLDGESEGMPGYAFGAPAHPGLPDVMWDRNNASAALRRLHRAAGVEWATAHSHRRGLITELHRDGVPLADIAAFVGHSTIQPTIGYVKVKSDPGRAAAIAARLGGDS